MIRYQVDLSESRSHRVRVRMSVLDASGDALDVAMPVWTPGSYLVREFARHVVELTATDDGGRPLPAEKTDKNTWRVQPGGSRVVHVDYTLFANERSVRTNHADDRHAFLCPAATFLFLRGRQGEPHHVRIEAPDGWSVYTGLSADGDGWLAADYDALVDGPFEVGPHRVLVFDHEGVPHRIVIAGEGRLDETQLQTDVAKIVSEVSGIFGTIPFDDYTFIVTLVDSGGGGLEHKNSSVNMFSRWSLHGAKHHRRLLGLLAHEYFHAWNVKRFRPAALGPFDYDRENYTTDLWVAEGLTSYYDDLSVLRAGFHEKVEEYLSDRTAALKELAHQPGARRMSLARASMDAWIKHYRPDENSKNSTVSYYSKGALVGMALDLRIRRHTGGEAALADVLRLGWERYASRGEGYPDGAIETLAAEVAGTDLTRFFDDYVTGTAPLDLAEDLAFVGLQLEVRPARSDRALARDDEEFLLEPTLGITTRGESGLCKVTAVVEGGPADEAGVNPDDLLLAVDSMRVTHGTLQDRLDRTRGEPVELTLFRGQALRRLSVRPALERLEDWKLVPVDDPTEAQAKAFHDWTGHDLPAGKSQDPGDDEEAADGARDG
ncbi:MAG: M61 family metallopeptidase [Planctomycetota bacterium]